LWASEPSAGVTAWPPAFLEPFPRQDSLFYGPTSGKHSWLMLPRHDINTCLWGRGLQGECEVLYLRTCRHDSTKPLPTLNNRAYNWWWLQNIIIMIILIKLWKLQEWDCISSTYLLTYLLTYVLTYSLTHSLTHSLTAWCRILFEKLIVTQLVKKVFRLLMEPDVSLPC
jgi:hypothetical protein